MNACIHDSWFTISYKKPWSKSRFPRKASWNTWITNVWWLDIHDWVWLFVTCDVSGYENVIFDSRFVVCKVRVVSVSLACVTDLSHSFVIHVWMIRLNANRIYSHSWLVTVTSSTIQRLEEISVSLASIRDSWFATSNSYSRFLI